MGVLYMSFGSKVRPRTFWCIAMGCALLFILMSRLLLYSAWSAVNTSTSCFVCILCEFVLSRQKLYVGMVVCITSLVLVCGCDVICVGHDLNWCSVWC